MSKHKAVDYTVDSLAKSKVVDKWGLVRVEHDWSKSLMKDDQVSSLKNLHDVLSADGSLAFFTTSNMNGTDLFEVFLFRSINDRIEGQRIEKLFSFATGAKMFNYQYNERYIHDNDPVSVIKDALTKSNLTPLPDNRFEVFYSQSGADMVKDNPKLLSRKELQAKAKKVWLYNPNEDQTYYRKQASDMSYTLASGLSDVRDYYNALLLESFNELAKNKGKWN